MGGLTYQELSGLVQGRRFTEPVLDIAEFTADTGVEAGMVVYKDHDGSISVSEVIKPDKEYQDRIRESDDDPALAGSPEVNLGRLIADSELNLRLDLALIGHSHPLLHHLRRNPRSMLMPSATDLLNFSEHVSFNPGLIGGTIATHRDLGGVALFLWRGGPEFAPQRLQNLRPGMVINEARLTGAGLRTATLAYNRRTGDIHSGLESLYHLFDQ